MYPAHYFNLFPAFPQTSKIFVAMSFAERFNARYDVISQAVNNITHNGVQCEPFRVDARTVSDSILTEILDGVRSSFLVFADISTIGKCDGIDVRNGNVMYEVGIAHAVRLPEEVLLFRSDDDRLPFDTSNVRVNKYDPESSPEDAFRIICDAIINASKEISLRRHLAVQKAASILDHSAWTLLEEIEKQPLRHPIPKTVGDIVGGASKVQAINKLLELGLIQMRFAKVDVAELVADPKKLSESMSEYFITRFGHEVCTVLKDRLLDSLQSITPAGREQLKKILAEKPIEPPTT